MTGGIVGVMTANAMFDLPVVEWSTRAAARGHLVFAEAVATLGLLLVIFGVVRRRATVARSRSVATSPAPLLHFVDELRQPSCHHRPHLLQHLRRHRPGLGSAFVLAQLPPPSSPPPSIRLIYPHISDIADQVIVPHDAAPVD